MRKSNIAAIVDAPMIDGESAADAGDVMLKFYRELGWNGIDSLDPRKVRTTKAVYDRILEAMDAKCQDRLAVGAAMVNKGPGVDVDVPPDKVRLLKGWTVSAIEELNRRENELFISFGGMPPEANDELNDLQREKIVAVHGTYGKAFIGKINFHGEERKTLTVNTVFAEFTGQMICNFDADFVLPDTDNTLAEMIVQWNAGGASVAILNQIHDRIEELSGLVLLWS